MNNDYHNKCCNSCNDNKYPKQKRRLSSSSSEAATTARMVINYEKEMTSNTLSLAQTITNNNNNNNNNCTKQETYHNHNDNQNLNQRRALSKAITLIESRNVDHIHQGDLLLNYLIEMKKLQQGNDNVKEDRVTTFRIGIAGPPGAGKSSFIEKFGIYLLDMDDDYKEEKKEEKENHDKDSDGFHYPSKLAALCIDPSSTLTGGSILGDKTRMTELSRHPKVRKCTLFMFS